MNKKIPVDDSAGLIFRGGYDLLSYVKIGAMLALCLFIPPLGWLFMYKYSPFDRNANIAIAAICTAFFIYANISAGNLGKDFDRNLTPEIFREKFNTSARKLAPNLNLTIDAPLDVDGKIFRHEFAPQLTLEGSTDADGNVTALKIFAAPENQDESFKTLNVLGLLIATLNPELDVDDRSEVLRDLRMLKNVAAEDAYDWTTSRGNVEYSIHADAGNVTFTAALK